MVDLSAGQHSVERGNCVHHVSFVTCTFVVIAFLALKIQSCL